MPAFAREYGVMPWHFGGDEELTYSEAEEFTQDLRETAKRQRDMAKRAPTPVRRPRR